MVTKRVRFIYFFEKDKENAKSKLRHECPNGEEEKTISEFQKLSLSKRGFVRNLSCENEFLLHEN